MRIYLLSLGQLAEGTEGEYKTEAWREGSASLIGRSLSLLDEERKGKVRVGAPEVALRELGAGLLLQFAAGRWRAEAQTAKKAASTLGSAPMEEQAAEQGEDRGRRFPIERLTLEEMLLSMEKERDRYPFSFTFRYGPSGKPYWEDPDLPYFSLSHSGEYVLLALSETEVGADLQETRSQDYRKMAERFFSPGEAGLLQREAPENRAAVFFRLWTRKEAFGKCQGSGLNGVLGEDLGDLGRGAATGYLWQEGILEPGYYYCICSCRHNQKGM